MADSEFRPDDIMKIRLLNKEAGGSMKMSDNYSKYTAPKKKKRVKTSHHGPFPVPIPSITLESTNKWYYYRGQLVGSSVLVTQPGDMHYLYNMGFFGKGSLSRSGVNYKNQFPTVTNDQGETLQVIQRQRYVRHLNWKKESEMTGTKDSIVLKEYDSDSAPDGNLWNPGASCSNDLRCEKDMKSEPFPKDENSSKTAERLSPVINPELGWTFDSESNDWSAVNTSSKDANVDDWATQEADCDFWGLSVSDVTCKVETSNKNNHNIWSNSDRESEHIKTEKTNLHSDENGQNAFKNIECQGIFREKVDEENRSSFNYSQRFIEKERLGGESSGMCHPSHTASNTTSGDCQLAEINKYIEQDKIVNDQPMKSLDSLCKSHEPDGDVLVVSDVEDENLTNQKHGHNWKPVIKQDPYKLREHLQLSLQEAFFLSYGLGCFVCVDKEKKAMNLTEMWQLFRSKQPSFIPLYITYHHFRSKGWVPKSGIKFGVDFIVYKKGPPFYHASFSVLVRMVDEVTLNCDPSCDPRSLNWASLSGLNRITENVSKELLMCFVIKPSGFNDKDLQSPACISQFKVKEVLVKRWIPAQSRQNNTSQDPT